VEQPANRPTTSTTATTSTTTSDISTSARSTYEAAKDKAGAAVDSARDRVSGGAAAAPAGDEDLHRQAQHEAEGIKGRLQVSGQAKGRLKRCVCMACVDSWGGCHRYHMCWLHHI
jgi:hypothetical protein